MSEDSGNQLSLQLAQLDKIVQDSNQLKWKCFFIARIVEKDIASSFIIMRIAQLAHQKEAQELSDQYLRANSAMEAVCVQNIVDYSVPWLYSSQLTSETMKTEANIIFSKLKQEVHQVMVDVNSQQEKRLILHQKIQTLKCKMMDEIYKKHDGGKTERLLMQCYRALIDLRRVTQILECLFDVRQDHLFTFFKKFKVKDNDIVKDLSYHKLLTDFQYMSSWVVQERERFSRDNMDTSGYRKRDVNAMKSLTYRQVKATLDLLVTHPKIAEEIDPNYLDQDAAIRQLNILALGA